MERGITFPVFIECSLSLFGFTLLVSLFYFLQHGQAVGQTGTVSNTHTAAIEVSH